jgi:UDP-glucose 4-epimerase
VRALVTGGAGFIGSAVVDALVERGDDVVVLDDLSSGSLEQVDAAASIVQGDVADRDPCAAAVHGCEVVLHLAAHRSVVRSVDHPLRTNRANVEGTLNVLLAARDAGVRRVVYASSSSVYGGAIRLPTPEDEPLRPRSPYAVTKVAGEHYCRVFGELFGLEAVSLRYFNVFGPRQRPDSRYATVIPAFISALQSGVAAEIHGDGSQRRDFSFVGDVVRSTLLAADAPAARCAGRAYNVAGGRSVSILELLDAVARVMGVEPRKHHEPPRAGDVAATHADLSAIAADLGFAPDVSLEEGLARTVEWFLSTSEPRASLAATARSER